MADPYLSEIKIVAFNYAPRGWALCNGQFLPINQNQALFSLLGTTYGGNGQTTFRLPEMRGRIPMHEGSGFTLGQSGGQEVHTLTMAEMPQHIHVANANSGNAATPIPAGNLLAAGNNMYAAPTNLVSLDPSSVSNVGGSQAHNNMQPYTALNFIIALQGIFPSQN